MEKLKQAVEKAKQQREQKKSILQSNEESSLNNAIFKKTSQSLIVYTQTKVVNIVESVFKKNRMVTENGMQSVSTAYKILRTHVAQLLNENGWNSVAITSANSGEGKTLTATNLALSLAKKVDQTVLLVDLDLRKPGIHKMFDYAPACGIDDYINFDANISDILFNPGIDGLVVMPCRNSHTNSSEMLSSPRMIELVNDIKNRYPSRIIIFDLPPILSVEDALAFAPYVDSALLVVREGKTTQKDISKSLEMLRTTNVLGTVMNNAKYSRPSYANYT